MSLRKQFEQHYNSIRGGHLPDWVFEQRELNNGYSLMPVQSDWELWQAAVAASGRDDLLAALESLLVVVETTKCPKNLDDSWMLITRFAAPIAHARSVIAKAGGVKHEFR